MKKLFVCFVRDKSGVTAIEYGLIAALVAVASIAGYTSVGTSLAAKLATISAAL